MIDAFGDSTRLKGSRLELSSAKAVITGLSAAGVRHLAVISTLDVRDSADRASFAYDRLLILTMIREVVSGK